MSDVKPRSPRIPPPWFVHTAWRAHRMLYRLSGGRFLWTPSSKRGWGGVAPDDHRSHDRSGAQRDHRYLAAHPDALVRLKGGSVLPVRAHAASGGERERLWRSWLAVDPQCDDFARLRATATPVVVFKPRTSAT